LEHARERHPRDSVSYRPVNYEPLLESGQLYLLDGDSEILPGLQLTVMPGHNRSMMIVELRSQGQTWCHLADLVQFAAQITPTWVSGFDLFPLEAIDNKTRLLGKAAAEDWWCSFGHEPACSFAKMEVQEGKWRVLEQLA
jgi:glyoxylase-like metal-dependent hydrolase (beta-lactamase superfamily II)